MTPARGPSDPQPVAGDCSHNQCRGSEKAEAPLLKEHGHKNVDHQQAGGDGSASLQRQLQEEKGKAFILRFRKYCSREGVSQYTQSAKVECWPKMVADHLGHSVLPDEIEL